MTILFITLCLLVWNHCSFNWTGLSVHLRRHQQCIKYETIRDCRG